MPSGKLENENLLNMTRLGKQVNRHPGSHLVLGVKVIGKPGARVGKASIWIGGEMEEGCDKRGDNN
jgi:hypothetical protein